MNDETGPARVDLSPATIAVNGERLSVLGWGRAILLQLAHPLVAAGVHEHSSFRGSVVAPFARLHGTMKNGVANSGMWVRVTYGMRKIDGTWLIAHDQVSVPFDIASGTGVVDLEP